MQRLKETFHSYLALPFKAFFYISLTLLVVSFSWNTGWNIVGDPFALGPYSPWLELIFPLSGLALWCVFFSQWVLGNLRSIHVTRWFYLLLFISGLMLNVLYSTQPESSLGYLSLWLTASLALSMQLEREFSQVWFWTVYLLGIVLSLILWLSFPAFINSDLLMMSAFFAALQAQQKTSRILFKLGLIVSTLALGFILQSTLGVQFFMVLTWLFLLWQDFNLYRRKLQWVWGLIVLGILAFTMVELVPHLSLEISAYYPKPILGSYFSWWHGVGIGQFEWAQFQAQTEFASPKSILTHVPLLSRWWYETGIFMLVLMPCLWLLTLGQEQNFRYRTRLFWGSILLASNLWLSPGGIILGAFWFFNRQSLKRCSSQLPAESGATSIRYAIKRQALKLHWPVKFQDGNVIIRSEAEKPQ